jgi:hypothetical protein
LSCATGGFAYSSRQAEEERQASPDSAGPHQHQGPAFAFDYGNASGAGGSQRKPPPLLPLEPDSSASAAEVGEAGEAGPVYEPPFECIPEDLRWHLPSSERAHQVSSRFNTRTCSACSCVLLQYAMNWVSASCCFLLQCATRCGSHCREPQEAALLCGSSCSSFSVDRPSSWPTLGFARWPALQIISQTAKFVRGNGSQVEVLLRVKHGANPNFAFLKLDDRLFPYYRCAPGGCFRPGSRTTGAPRGAARGLAALCCAVLCCDVTWPLSAQPLMCWYVCVAAAVITCNM